MNNYKWTFANVGGATRVHISTADDLRHLASLDQKLWTVLSCPTDGLEIPDESLHLMDGNNDGVLHVNEVVQTAEWLCSKLQHPEVLFLQQSSLAIEDILDADIQAIARQISSNEQVTLADVDAAIAAVTVEEQPLPAAPFEANVIAAYHSKQAEYAAYFVQVHLQKIGLVHIPEDTILPGITEKDFLTMGQQIADYESASQAISDSNAAALAAAKEQFAPLRKLLILSRDFVTLLHNFITFDDFYSFDASVKAIFQAGTLIIDQRACQLCMRVRDMAKHDTQAAASGMYLVYCDCTSKTLAKSMQIVAAVTVGEIRNLSVGKNAIFYDRQGNDWDAVVTKIIDNPISIGQAFWSPYRKFAAWVSGLINKSVAEKDSKALEDMKANAEATSIAGKTPADGEKKQMFDIAKFAGIFAAIGMALGYLGAFLTDLAKGINAMPAWQLLVWIAGLILVISGPSMLLAWFKLRRRNLAPLLNANGWAVNADALVSVPFGATLTEKAQYPLIKLHDPFAKKGLQPWHKWLIAILSIAVISAIVWACIHFTQVEEQPLVAEPVSVEEVGQ